MTSPMCIALLIALLCGPTIPLSLAAQSTAPPKAASGFDHSYARYDKLLKRHVKDGLVSYAALQRERTDLDTLVEQIAAAKTGAMTREQQLAFYINAYNIITIRSIVDAFPVASIRDIDGVWKSKQWTVAGELVTLDGIEHQILRKRFSEPRIHCAIVCASIGCPILQSFAYCPDSLDSQLAEASRSFARSSLHNSLSESTKRARISSIFDWFGDDFVANWKSAGRIGSLGDKETAAINFLIAHQPEEKQAALRKVAWTVDYVSYDWSLNNRP